MRFRETTIFFFFFYSSSFISLWLPVATCHNKNVNLNDTELKKVNFSCSTMSIVYLKVHSKCFFNNVFSPHFGNADAFHSKIAE